MNCDLINRFLMSKIKSEFEKEKLVQIEGRVKEVPVDAVKRSKENARQYLSCIKREMLRKNIKNPLRSPLNVMYNWRINNGCNVKYIPLNAQPQYCKKNALHNTMSLSKARAAKSSVF